MFNSLFSKNKFQLKFSRFEFESFEGYKLFINML